MGRAAKTKGANAEREVARLLQPIVDQVYAEAGQESPTLKRNLEQTRGGGYDLVGVDWMALEIKRHEQLSINSWWQQTLRQTQEGQEPILMFRQSRQKWRVMMMGWLKTGAGKAVRARVEVGLDDFLVYFRKRIENEVSI